MEARIANCSVFLWSGSLNLEMQWRAVVWNLYILMLEKCKAASYWTRPSVTTDRGGFGHRKGSLSIIHV